MKRYFLMVLSTCALLLSCAKENNEPVIVDGKIRLNITAAAENTRTTLGDEIDGVRKISWVKGDAIKVLYGTNPSEAVVAYAAESGETTTFVVDVPATATSLYAVYPATALDGFSNGAITIEVPAFQTGDFGSANIAVARCSVKQPGFAFKNVCGYVLTDITESNIHKVTLTADGQNLSGKISVTVSETGEVTLGEITEGSSQATAYFNTSGQQIVALLPGVSFTGGVNVAFANADGSPISSAVLRKDFTLSRGNVLNTGKMDESTSISLFASVNGSGNKKGTSADNAWGVSELAAWLAQENPSVPTGKAADAPFNITLAAGRYSFPSGVTIAAKGRDLNLFASGEVVFTCPESVTGSLFYTKAAGTFSFTGINFSGHKGNGTGKTAFNTGRPADGSQQISMSGCTFSGNTNTGVGAALVLNNGGNNYLRNCTFSGNSAGGGAALNIDYATTVCEMTGCQFTNNVSVAYSTSQDSGALKIGDGTVTATSCSFSGNYVASGANGGGGAVWVGTSSATLPILFDQCSFNGNSVKNDIGRGGAVYITRGSNTVFKGCTFSSNACSAGTKTSYGGAVALGNANNHGEYDIQVTFDGCTFNGNSVAGIGANGGYCIGAGAIYMQQGDGKTTTCTVKDCSIKKHILNNRSAGGIYADSGTLNIIGGDFTGNDTRNTYTDATALSYAGALEIVNAACTISGGTVFSGNWTSSGGGAIFIPYNYSGTLSIDWAVFNENKTTSGGGGAFRIAQEKGQTFTFKNVNFSGNEAASGGAICNYKNTNLTISGCTFTGNKATSLGGAIYSGCEDDCQSTLTLSDCSFTGNESHNGGGAIEISNNQNSKKSDESYNTCRGNLIVDGCTFQNNVSDAYGGAIGSRTSGTLRVTGSTFEGNSTTVTGSTGSGGAISIKYGQTIANHPELRGQAEISGCTFKNNHTGLGSANSQARGGAIAVTNSSNGASYEDVRIDKCSFISNYATQGGAILAHNGTFQTAATICLWINDCLFDSNHIAFRIGTTMTCFYLTELAVNNCTFRNSWGGSSQAYTNLGWLNLTSCNSTLLSNCTLIGQPSRANNDVADAADGNLIRLESDKTGCTYTLVNNIVVSPKSWCKSLMRTEGTNANTFNLYSNKLSAVNDNLASATTDSFNGTDWLGLATYFGGLNWVAGDTYANSGWAWNGSLATGTPTTTNTLADVKAKIQSANSNFYTWLESGSIGGTAVAGLDKDQRGNNRGTNTWPGALQN
ncbi:MAG: hypothetical protein IJR34_03565 [Bacteroidales bacterium]|nr:hypothetical protein [Bacteroidales bacterium]